MIKTPYSVVFIITVVISQSNKRYLRFFLKKLVDAKRRYTHNAPRNAEKVERKKEAT